MSAFKLHFIAFCCCIAFHSVGLCQKKADQKATRIDSLFNAHALKTKELKSMSACGGHLQGFYYQNELVFIHTVYQSPLGFTDTKWYLENGELFKIVRFGFEYEEPEDLDAYCKTHRNANNECDFSGLKSRSERTVAYFQTWEVLLQVIDNVETKLDAKNQKRALKSIKRCFKSLVDELNSNDANFI